jgi:hypothetical protein
LREVKREMLIANEGSGYACLSAFWQLYLGVTGTKTLSDAIEHSLFLRKSQKKVLVSGPVRHGASDYRRIGLGRSWWRTGGRVIVYARFISR